MISFHVTRTRLGHTSAFDGLYVCTIDGWFVKSQIGLTVSLVA